jgi:hypothetical protein
MPAATLSGTTTSKTDTSFMPGFAFIYHPSGVPLPITSPCSR